jgi:16S rRNA (uracil1498-N3)-methyltransferase
MQLFYNPEINNTTTDFSFSKEESKHIVKVLRKDSGDILDITNGKGWLFKAQITIPNIKKCVVKIISKTKQPN